MCQHCENTDRSEPYDGQLSALRRAYAEKQAQDALRLMTELDALSDITPYTAEDEGGHV